MFLPDCWERLWVQYLNFEIQGEAAANQPAVRKEPHSLCFAVDFDSDQVDFDWARY